MKYETGYMRRPTMSRITIQEIAEKAGVSKATVSRVLSNSPNVHPDTRRAVLDVVAQYSYKPSMLARSLAKGSFPAIHVLLSDVSNPFYAELVHGVEDVAMESGYTVVLANTEDKPERELGYLRVAAEHSFAGVILMSSVGTPKIRSAIRNLSCPVVLVVRRVEGLRADSVTVDDERGGYEATKYLILLGHRAIGHLAGPSRSSASAARAVGFRKAMAEAGLDIREDLVVQGDLRQHSGERYAEMLLEKGMPVTAVFAANDQMAIGIMGKIVLCGGEVPRDLSVVGYDDMVYSSLPLIRLTTVRVPQREMGRAAARLLLDRIQGDRPAGKAVASLVFEPELVVRDSCGPPQQASNLRVTGTV